MPPRLASAPPPSSLGNPSTLRCRLLYLVVVGSCSSGGSNSTHALDVPSHIPDVDDQPAAVAAARHRPCISSSFQGVQLEQHRRRIGEQRDVLERVVDGHVLASGGEIEGGRGHRRQLLLK